MRNTELYDFQKIGVRMIRDFDGRALLADEVGLGKTLQSLYYARQYLPTDPSGPIVVVVPAHLKLVWKREAQKHLGIRVQILDGERVPPDTLPPMDRNSVLVVNYEILHPPHWRPRTRPVDDSWIMFLANLKPRLVIGDEAHRLKSSSAQCTRAFRWLSRLVPHVLLLTGTPLANKPKDLWSLLNIINPREYPSEWDFAFHFTHPKKRPWGWEFNGARNLDELNRSLLDSCMIRRRKIDVLDQLPSITHTVIPMTVDLREYRRAESDFIGWLTEKSPTMARSAANAEELVRMNQLKQLAGQLKTDSVVRWALDLIDETNGKLLLGAIHYSVTKPLMRAFKKRAVLVDGRIGGDEKNELFDRFNNDPKCRIMVGNIEACSTGWSCRSTSDGALCELPWRPCDVSQFFGRIHGIDRGLSGQPTHARYLIAEDTIESDLCKVLQTKAEWSSEAVDGIEGNDGINVFDQLKAMMRERNKK